MKIKRTLSAIFLVARISLYFTEHFKMKLTTFVPFAVALVFLGGCATYKQTLTNSKGESVTCEASGKNGFVTGLYVRQAFESCVDAAHTKGYN